MVNVFEDIKTIFGQGFLPISQPVVVSMQPTLAGYRRAHRNDIGKIEIPPHRVVHGFKNNKLNIGIIANQRPIDAQKPLLGTRRPIAYARSVKPYYHVCMPNILK